MTTMVVAWLFLLYWPTAWSMVETWNRSETFAHGYLVLPIALWLVWQRREVLQSASFTPSWWAAWSLLPLGLLWLVGDLAAANVVSQWAFIGLMAGSIVALVGKQVATNLAFPLGFLFFAVPAGEFLIPQLMEWTARFTVLGLRLSGVPVYQEGLEFVIPSGNWSVVEACSGIRYLIASLMVGTLFAYLNFRSLSRRLAFVAFSIAVPVAANWIRAYLIVMIGHFSGNRLAMGVDHLIYGWLFFGLVVLVMFGLGSRWADADAITAPDKKAVAVPVPAFGADWRAAVLVGLLVALPVVGRQGIRQMEAGDGPVLAASLSTFSPKGWHGADYSLDGAWQPDFKGAADKWHREFQGVDLPVAMHVGYFRHQDHDRKFPVFTVALGHGSDNQWAVLSRGQRRVTSVPDTPEINTARLRPRGTDAPGRDLVVWQWYRVAGRNVASAATARAYALLSRIMGRGDDVAVILLSVPASQADQAELVLESFLRSAGPILNSVLDAVRSRQ